MIYSHKVFIDIAQSVKQILMKFVTRAHMLPLPNI